MESLNGSEVEGKQLMVNEARPKAPNSGGGNRGGRPGGGGYGGGGRDRRY